MRASRLSGMAQRGNYAGMAAFADPAADAGILEAGPFAALMSADREHDLVRARRACAAKDLKWFTDMLCMTILADLGDRDRSFAIAAQLYPASLAPPGADPFWLDHPDAIGTAILTGPAGRSMRTDPRFLELAQKLGLLKYWRSGRVPDFCAKAHEAVCARIYPRRT